LRLLLDTHALLWWGHGDRRLSARACAEIDSDANERFVSAVSAMEIATKFRLGKLPEAYALAANFEADIAEMGFQPLAISVGHARLAGSLAIPHKDPFDRLLIAQAMLEGMTLVSNEAGFDPFGVARLW
jgi:PIN domain nuclease of toxin-antitoxin system